MLAVIIIDQRLRDRCEGRTTEFVGVSICICETRVINEGFSKSKISLLTMTRDMKMLALSPIRIICRLYKLRLLYAPV